MEKVGSKKCTKCKELKEFKEFYRDKRTKDSLYSHCKKCHFPVNKLARYEYLKKWKAKNLEKYHAFQRKGQKKWYMKNREKLRAYWKLKCAVERGEIVRPKQCSKCPFVGKIQGHHTDYSKPLDVMWLCKRCHENEHHLILTF